MTPTSEQRRAARVATISALMVVSAYVAGKAGRDAILLSNFSIKTLPLFIGISAAVSLPIIFLAGKLMTRFGPARLVPMINVLSGLLAIAEYFLLPHYPRPTAILVFFHLNVASAVLVSGFWSIVNERFDIQTAKRHIGQIGMGATIGGIFGGVIAERTAVYFAPETILLVIAALQLICAGTMLAFARGEVRRPPPETKPEGSLVALGIVAKSSLLRNLGAIVILGAMVGGTLDYVFKADIVHGATHDGLLRSLALFYTATNVITAVIQLAVCGPIIAKLGVPRSVATLPIAVTGFGVLALLVPSAVSAMLARGAELVTRNSIYRAGYELLYAPLPDAHKRPTKVVLDVGADKMGDIFGAQVVGMVLFFATDVRTGLLIATLVIAVIFVFVALRLPRSYTKALEESLLNHAETGVEDDGKPREPEPWLTLSDLPTFGHPSDVVPLRIRGRRAKARKSTALPAAPLTPPDRGERLVETVRDLGSGDPARIKRALGASFGPELAGLVIELVGRDDVAGDVVAALGAIAPRCTGLLVDALLDPSRDPSVRRRLPAILLHGDPALAAWGLWRGVSDPSFEVRYRCCAVLSRLAGDGQLKDITEEQVFETVRRELAVDISDWRHHNVAYDPVFVADTDVADEDERPRHTGLEHVFRILGLALPAEPLRIALRAVRADDQSMRGTALEYLESVLPPDVRAQLWPLLDNDDPAALGRTGEHPAMDLAPKPNPRSKDEMIAELRKSFVSSGSKLKRRAP